MGLCWTDPLSHQKTQDILSKEIWMDKPNSSINCRLSRWQRKQDKQRQPNHISRNQMIDLPRRKPESGHNEYQPRSMGIPAVSLSILLEIIQSLIDPLMIMLMDFKTPMDIIDMDSEYLKKTRSRQAWIKQIIRQCHLTFHNTGGNHNKDHCW